MPTEVAFDLKRHRERTLRWPQQKLADFLGRSQAAVSRMEKSGKVGRPYLKLLATISPPYITTHTQDGTVIVVDPETGQSASGTDEIDALAELRRVLASRPAAA